MMQLSLKMMTHHFVITSSLLIKIFLIDKFCDFSSDIDFNTKIDICSDVISLIIKQCDPRRPKGACGGHKVSTGGSLRSPGVTLFNYKGDNISTYVYLSVKIYIT